MCDVIYLQSRGTQCGVVGGSANSKELGAEQLFEIARTADRNGDPGSAFEGSAISVQLMIFHHSITCYI
jgi:hypothetical protein